MPVIGRTLRPAGLMGFCALLAGAMLSGAAFGQPAGIDPQAEKLFAA